MFGPSAHEQAVAFKRQQREDRINALTTYREPLSAVERDILDLTVPEAVKLLRAGEITQQSVLKAYGKQALISQEQFNPLTEIMIEDAENRIANVPTSSPLAGFPVSLKDPFVIKGFDASSGYSSRVNKPSKEDGEIVQVVRAAGGVPFVKTNVPITLMNIEGYNDVFGRTLNPHNPHFAPGGSSQGEGALIGSGGSRIGIGTDIGGSVRVPAAWSGIYSLRMTSYRFPARGDVVNDNGYEGLINVASPMARTLTDLRFFTNAMMETTPADYDYALIPLPWRADASVPPKPKVGVLKMDEFIPLTKAQGRALDMAVDALRKQGSEIVPFKLPEHPSVYNDVEFKLNAADGMYQLTRYLLPGEHTEWIAAQIQNYLWWPRWLRKTWEWALRFCGYGEKAHMLSLCDNYSVLSYYDVVHKRNTLRKLFREAWKRAEIDFLITAPHPSPAVPNNNPEILTTILYTTLFNLLDYPAGIVPVSRVAADLDAEDYPSFSGETQIIHDLYDAKKMAGLPTAVQVAGMRYRDEETLAAMAFTEDALHKAGVFFK